MELSSLEQRKETWFKKRWWWFDKQCSVWRYVCPKCGTYLSHSRAQHSGKNWWSWTCYECNFDITQSRWYDQSTSE